MKRIDYDELARHLMGSPVLNISRVFFVHGDHIDQTAGRLQLTNANGVYLFEPDSDGESLRIIAQPYFELYPDYQNDPDMKRYGYYKIFDVSKEHGYCPLIGQRVRSVAAISRYAKTTGASIIFEAGEILDLLIDGDDSYVSISNASPL